MKKITLVLTTLMFLTIASFAKDAKDVSTKVKASFEKIFSAAYDIKWERSNKSYLATFKMDGQNVSALYNEEGELKRSSRSLSLSHLPLKVLTALQERYEGYDIDNTVSEVFENNETNYYIKVENRKHKIILVADASGSFMVEDKVKKK